MIRLRPRSRAAFVCVARCSLLALFAALSAAPLRAQPAEIQFVFGSDTSSPGLNVARYALRFNNGHLALYTSPSGAASVAMDDALRARYRDSYGTPLKLTWWMQVGSLYEPARNTNVPLPSTQTLHLMRAYWHEALARHGDEVSLHYHSWVWTDYDGDGIPYWNQALTYGEFRDGFDRALAQSLIEEETYAVSFRSGWHYMDNAWQARLDSLLPFSMHNDSPHRGIDDTEPLDNLLDWSRAPLDFVPFRPRADDYQLPGGSGGWNVRSISFPRAREPEIRKVFEQAREGVAQVVVIWDHLADARFIPELERAAGVVLGVAADFPDVRFRFATGVEAMQRWLGTDDDAPPQLSVSEIVQGEQMRLRIETDEAIFQTIPFVALKDRYERYHALGGTRTGERTWETEPFRRADAAQYAVAVTDSVGNLAQHHRALLPADRFFDVRSGAYAETDGAWQTVQAAATDEVWGNDYRVATIAPGQQATAEWTPDVAEEGRYNVFVRFPAVAAPAADITVRLRVGGEVIASTRLSEPPPANEWFFAGQADLGPSRLPVVEVLARGTGSTSTRLAADALRLSALIRDRQLELATPVLNAGDVVLGDTTRAAIGVRNLGTERLTIVGITSERGQVRAAVPLPFVVDRHAAATLPLHLLPGTPGLLADTLIVESDDPVHPVMRVPVTAQARDYFIIVDDEHEGYAEQGTWATSVTQSFGNRSRYKLLSTASGASATFTTEVARTGLYDLAFIVPGSTNSAEHAAYSVWIDGERADSLVLDQNTGSGAWRSLDTYRLQKGARVAVRVEATRAEPGRVLRADAVRLSFLGEHLREQIADNDDEGYSESGAWQQSGAQAYGPTSRFANAAAGAVAVFRLQVQQDGFHALFQIVPETENASTQAEYRVLRNGSAAGSVRIDQNHRSGTWRFLDSYYLSAGDSVVVEVRHSGASEGGRVLRADAVKLAWSDATPSSAGSAEHPSAVSLDPVYPNPARGIVHFRYHVRDGGPVRLRVFDVLGREVATLVDGIQNPGTHAATFDASHLSSGVYFSHLEAGGVAAVQRWVLLR